MLSKMTVNVTICSVYFCTDRWAALIVCLSIIAYLLPSRICIVFIPRQQNKDGPLSTPASFMPREHYSTWFRSSHRHWLNRWVPFQTWPGELWKFAKGWFAVGQFPWGNSETLQLVDDALLQQLRNSWAGPVGSSRPGVSITGGACGQGWLWVWPNTKL